MHSCEINAKAPDGTPSALYEELKKLYAKADPRAGEAAAYEVLLQVRRAQDAGYFGSRTPRS